MINASAVFWLLTTGIIAGLLTFGGVYFWGHPIVFSLAGFAGTCGLLLASRDDWRWIRPVAIALFGVGAVIVAQLIPLPSSVLSSVSPARGALLSRYEIGFDAIRPGTLSIDSEATRLSLIAFISFALLIIGVASAISHFGYRRIGRMITIVGTITALEALAQKATSGRLLWFWQPYGENAQPFGTFVNRNHFAGWMVMALALTFAYLAAQIADVRLSKGEGFRKRLVWLSSRDANRIVMCIFGCVAMVMATFWTMSRSGVFALAALTVAFSVRLISSGRASRGVIAAMLLLAVMVMALVWRGVDNVSALYGQSATLDFRIELWKDSLPILSEFPWFGTGFNTYRTTILLYPRSDYTYSVSAAHNDYLNVATDGGAIGLTAVAIAIAAVGYRAINGSATPTSESERWIRFGAFAGMFAIGIQELADFSLQIPANAFLFSVLVGIAISRPRGHKLVQETCQ